MPAVPWAAAALVALALSTGLSGCLTCQDQVDVHHCVAETGRCDVATKRVEDWDAANLTALWPDVTRLMGEVAVGEHDHANWSPSQVDAFWALWGVTDGRHEILLRHDGGLYHLRTQSC